MKLKEENGKCVFGREAGNKRDVRELLRFRDGTKPLLGRLKLLPTLREEHETLPERYPILSLLLCLETGNELVPRLAQTLLHRGVTILQRFSPPLDLASVLFRIRDELIGSLLRCREFCSESVCVCAVGAEELGE